MAIRRAKKRKYILNDTRIKACLRRFDDNVYTRLEFLKAVSHSTEAHSCDLYTEATDSDGDSPDDDQEDTDAVADAGAATVNATDANETANCEVCLVAHREPRLALVPCGHQRFCEACIRHLERILEVVVLSAVRTSTWFYVCFDILR